MKIKCRARLHPQCYDGRECRPIYGEDSMADDGTFNGESVICDACYIAGGQPAIYYGSGPDSHPHPPTREEILAHVDREMGLTDG